MLNSRSRTAITAALIILVLASTALAAKQVKITASKKLNYQGAKGDAMVEGDVKIEYDTTLITADKVIFNSDNKTARVDSGVRIVQDNIVITANVMNADFKTEKVTVSGNVKLEMTETLAEKDANGVAKKDVVSLLTSSMTIDINTNDFTASGGIVISKDKQKAQSSAAAYVEAEKKITLTGSVSIETSDGDTVKAEKAVIYTDKDTFEAEGERIEINFTV
jgi:lipopolysaccharide export system protein LptA